LLVEILSFQFVAGSTFMIIFLYQDLRLQLLEPENHPYLFKCLYGILMLLPQSGAFTTLRTRLNSVSSMGILNLMPKEKPKTQQLSQVDFTSLLNHFVKVQKSHQDSRKKSLNFFCLFLLHRF
jgi:vacuole morphology and inheritance protein 14